MTRAHDVELAPVRVLLSLRPDAILQDDGDTLVVGHPWGHYRLRGLPPGPAAALHELAAATVDPGELAETPADLVQLHVLLERLAPLLCRTVALGERRLATAVPMAPDAALRWRQPVTPDTAVRLSGFAYLRAADADGCGGALLESPLARHRVLLHDAAAAALVGALGCRAPLREPADAVPGLPLEAVLALIDLLVAADLAELDDVAPDPTLVLWDFHDLVFHARSRTGRHDHPFGALFRHRGTRAPLPAIAPPRTGRLIELSRPDWSDVVAADPTLTEVLESRRSVRTYDPAPVTLAQLGELLYRAARVRGVVAADPDAGLPYDAAFRPFPTGGGSGELELYLTVARCDGLEPGAYHYDAAAHGLRPIAASAQDCRTLLMGAWQATGGLVDPQVLVTITSRFGRLSWKYSGLAYAATLKHVGVLYQTLYLVATAMGLAPCALGSGNADAAVRAFGLDWASESSVGEFLVGSRPADAPAPVTGFDDLVQATRAGRAPR